MLNKDHYNFCEDMLACVHNLMRVTIFILYFLTHFIEIKLYQNKFFYL